MKSVRESFTGLVIVVAEVDGTWVRVARSAGDVKGELSKLGGSEIVGRERKMRRRR